MKVVDNWGQRASMNAAMAIRLDSIGRKAAAIEHYRRAIDALDKLTHVYRDYHLNKVFIERANAYQSRIRSLLREEEFNSANYP